MRRALFLVILASAACQSTKNLDAGANYQKGVYSTTIKNFTRHDLSYDGFHNKFEYHVTLLNSAVLKAQSRLQSLYSQWDRSDALQNLHKNLDQAAAETTFFLSFFSPKSEVEDLTRSKSPWTFYLKSGQTRYRGTVTRQSDPLSKLEKFYPYHNRFSSAFLVKFPVSTSLIENSPCRLIITGPVGSSTAEFPSISNN